jgi:hypothetical protein
MAMVDNTDPTKVGTVIARSTCDDDILGAGRGINSRRGRLNPTQLIK